MAYEMQRPMGYVSPAQGVEESSESRWKGKWKAREDEHIDASALEAEFEAHASELLRQDNEQHTELGHDVLMSSDRGAQEAVAAGHRTATQDHLNMSHDWDRMDDTRMMSDEPILEEEIKQEQPQPAATDDDLADAAGELLDRVADNESQKFKDSSFLALMRQLRDREVRVEGNQMVNSNEVSTPPNPPAPLPGHVHTWPPDHITCRVLGCDLAFVDALEYTG